MAAAVHELDGLYFHFKHLLFSGYDANLEIKSKDGKAYVSLSAELNVVEDNFKQKRSPSYYKRLERRKQERNKEKEAEQAVRDQDVVDCNQNSEDGKAVEAVPTMSEVDSQQKEHFNVAAAEAANETADEAEVLAAEEAADTVAHKADKADKEQ